MVDIAKASVSQNLDKGKQRQRDLKYCFPLLETQHLVSTQVPMIFIT